MKQILWFRRDLRITDNQVLSTAKNEVYPIFIFDKNILGKLKQTDKRVSYIYKEVLRLKEELKKNGLDLKIYYSTPKEVFTKLKEELGECEVLCSGDFDKYAIKRDEEINKILPLTRFTDSYIINPKDHLKKDQTPYKVYTPFYKSLSYIWESDKIEEYEVDFSKLSKGNNSYEDYPTLEEMGFEKQDLPRYLNIPINELISEFHPKLNGYQKNRDLFNIDGTSNFSVPIRFGVVSPRQLFNEFRSSKDETFIKELFWREFWNYILYHFPETDRKSFNNMEIKWNNDPQDFEDWKNGETGVPIIDAAMKRFKETGEIHNRLRMIVASFLTKNLLIDWKWGEEYFAENLLDYDASANIGSWQWAASTGADSVPYFRIFNPYTQSEKFDKKGLYIKQEIPELKDIDSKIFHKEGETQLELPSYTELKVRIKPSRDRCLETYKKAKEELENKKPPKPKIDLEF